MDPRLDAFTAARPRLLAVAYRMLGSAAEAEEVVQDAFVRWTGSSPPVEEVASPTGYLVRVVSRLCLDRLDRARLERERYPGPWLPEPVSPSASPEWAAALERAEEVSLAFLVVLEKLTPLERAALILHDMFDHSHEEIARILQRSEEACRQLLRRARAHVREEGRRFAADPPEHARLVQAFLAACRSGSVDQLTQLLAEDVRVVADGGGRAPAAVKPVVGRDRVARLFLGFVRLKAGLEITTELVNGSLAIVSRRPDGGVDDIVEVVSDGQRIVEMLVVRNPDKLTRLAAEAG